MQFNFQGTPEQIQEKQLISDLLLLNELGFQYNSSGELVEGSFSPFELHFAGGNSGYSFGYVQWDVASGNPIALPLLRDILEAAKFPGTENFIFGDQENPTELDLDRVDDIIQKAQNSGGNPGSLTSAEISLINDALQSLEGRQLINEHHPLAIDSLYAGVQDVISGITDAESQEYIQNSLIARLFISDVRNQFGTGTNADLETFLNGDEVTPPSGGVAVDVIGDLSLDDLFHFHMSTGYAQSVGGQNDLLRRFTNLVDLVDWAGPSNAEEAKGFNRVFQAHIKPNEEALGEFGDGEHERHLPEFKESVLTPVNMFLINNFAFGDLGVDNVVVDPGLEGGELNVNGGDDLVFGEEGNDIISTGDGNDYLYGGIGNDILTGGEGNDVYIFSRGDGQDVIHNYDTNILSRGGVLRFAQDITFEDLLFDRINDDLVIRISGTDDQVTVAGHFNHAENHANSIDRVEFYNPSSSSYNFYSGDYLGFLYDMNRFSPNSMIDGFVDGAVTIMSDHWLSSEIFSPSGGYTLIDRADSNVNPKALDVIEFNYGAGVVLYENSHAVEIRVGTTSDDITIYKQTDDSGLHEVRLNQSSDILYISDVRNLIFSDGTRLDYENFSPPTIGVGINSQGDDGNDEIKGTRGYDFLVGKRGDDLIYGDSGNDALIGDDGTLISAGGNDTLYGGSGADSLEGGYGNDRLVGGSGNDQLFGDHRSSTQVLPGNDTYEFTLGDGRDQITDLGGEDAIIIRGVSADANFDSMFAPRLVGGIKVLDYIQYSSTDRVTLSGQNNQARRIENVIFQTADGTVLRSYTYSEIEAILNSAPLITVPIVDQAATEDALFTFQLPANTFADPQGQVLNLSASLANGSPLPSWLSFNSQTRTFSGTPENSNVGTLQVSVMATDPDGLSVSDVFTLNVANTNDAPTLANAIAEQIVQEGESFNFTVPANTFSDMDAGDVLTLNATLADGSPLPFWLSFNSQTRTFVGAPQSDNAGALQVRVTAADLAGLSVSGVFTLTVNGTNDAPVLTNPFSEQTAAEGQVFNFTTPANTFTDPEGEVLNLSASLADGTSLPSWLSFDSQTRTFLGTPGNSDVGVLQVRVTAADPDGLSISDDFTLTVVGINDAPVLDNAISNQMADEGVAFNFTVPANTFSDADAGDTLTLSATRADGSALPAWISFNAQTGTFSGTPQTGDIIPLQIRVTATDSAGASVYSDFRLGFVGETMTGTEGNDSLSGGNGDDQLSGGLGNDTLSGSLGNDELLGEDGNDVLYAGGGEDELLGGNGNDTLYGDAGDDRQYGGAGTDSLMGGEGADLMDGGEGGDYAYYSSSNSAVQVDLSTGAAIGGYAQGDTLLNIEHIWGSAWNDALTGNASSNFLLGGLGNDTLSGMGGSDGLYGGSGNDQLTGGVGNDSLYGEADNDVLGGGAGNDGLQGGTGSDLYQFGIGDDQDNITEDVGGTIDTGSTDRVLFGADITTDELWFTREGNDLRIWVDGTDDQLQIKNWYTNSAPGIEQFETSTGNILLAGQVQQLVDAMAVFDPPNSGVMSIPQEARDEVAPVIAANWS